MKFIDFMLAVGVFFFLIAAAGVVACILGIYGPDWCIPALEDQVQILEDEYRDR